MTMGFLKRILRAITPGFLLSGYHLAFAHLGSFLYGFPSRDLKVIGITGTKGKSSTSEMVNAIFEAAGYKTVLINSIRFKYGDAVKPNKVGRSMPGRFFLQRALRKGLKRGCTVAILEMTSEGARQHRHRAIALDCLAFLNLAPEHIESHGSYEAYADAKFELGKALARSPKRPRTMVANLDDAQSARYLELPVEHKVGFSLEKCAPWTSSDRGGTFTFAGIEITINFPGEFSLKNAIAAAEITRAFGIAPQHVKTGLESLRAIPGRAERVEAGQPFTVVVDYAHTPDSMDALLSSYPMRKICIFGSAGGGRDTWKRPVMGAIAEKHCERVILTNDDPYDEDPIKILKEIAAGMAKSPLMIPDRRAAIREGLSYAKPGDAVLIIGKGTDPIAGPHGKKIPWSDATTAREEIEKRAAQGHV